MNYTHRYIARIILEAETALVVGSGETSLLKDALVQKDHHGFPMIPGTSLTGVLRHAIEDPLDKNVQTQKEKVKKWKSFFGYQQPNNKEGKGSQVKISSAYLLLNNSKIKIAEGLELTKEQNDLLKQFDNLPSRQHVKITHKGVAKENGLFENEVVYKGTQFIFEIEVKGDDSETALWKDLLKQLNNPICRLGQGTRNGYGKLKVISIKTKEFDLRKEDDFKSYLKYDPSFNASNACLTESKSHYQFTGNKLTEYRLDLTPDKSFFIFSSGFGDEDVDNQPLIEPVVAYQAEEGEQQGKIQFTDHTVIPASSVKGAISHRTCFHYNKLNKKWADGLEKNELDNLVGTNNTAVCTLFGAEAGLEEKSARGKVILNDLYFTDINNDKILNHVAIDRFTGGAMDGALFSERVSQKERLEFYIWLEQDTFEDETIIEAFENALKDICKGLLPLGGMTTKGHGIFTGSLFKNDIKIYPEDEETN